MPKPFRNLLVLTLIMTASCLDVTENNATTTTETSTLTSTSGTIAAEENASPSSSSSSPSDAVWECPNITKAGVECSCDFPHTLRCTGDRTARYCVVLLVPTAYDDMSLGLGCSDVIVLEETLKRRKTATEEQPPSEGDRRPSTSSTQSPLDSYPRITGVHVNVSDKGYLHVDVVLSRTTETILASPTCQLSVVVFDAISAIHRQRFNCSVAFVTDVKVSLPGYYRVCASLDELADVTFVASSGNLVDDRERFRCVDVAEQSYDRQNAEVFIAMAVVSATGVFLIVLAMLGRSLVKRLRHPRIPAQCFLPAQEFEITHKAHYIKLLATTKV